jgi:hypothetical protein
MIGIFPEELLRISEEEIICAGCEQALVPGLENQSPAHEKRKGDKL